MRPADWWQPRSASIAESRWYRPVAVGLTALAIVVLLFELGVVAGHMRPESVGVDFHQYLDHTRRWLDGGSLFLDRQLHGPYAIEPGDSLYPPTILYLTVPFALGLPEVVWWVVPMAIIVGAMLYHRPAPWTWPIIAAMLATPRAIEIVLYGNPVLWVTAALAAGTVAGWPSVGVLLKPSLAPLALCGVRRRSWWYALAAMAVSALPFGALWYVWTRVLPDSNGSLAYSLPDLLLVMVPVVAWIGRRAPRSGTRAEVPMARTAFGPEDLGGDLTGA